MSVTPPYSTPESPATVQHPLEPLLLANTINLIGGSSHSGKTPLMAWMMRQFLDKGPVLGYEQPRNNLPLRHAYLCLDRSWAASTRKTFLNVVDDIQVYCPSDDLTFDAQRFRRKAERLEVFEQCLEKAGVGPGTLVWVDPLSTFTGVAPLDPDNYLVVFSEMRAILKRRGLTLIGTVPGVKNTTEHKYLRPIDRIAGSFAQVSYADAVLFLTTPAEQHRKVYTLNVYPRADRPKAIDLTWNNAGQLIYALAEDEFREVLTAIPFAPGTIRVADLTTMLTPQPMSRPTLFRQLKELKAQSVIKLVERGVYSRAVPRG